MNKYIKMVEELRLAMLKEKEKLEEDIEMDEEFQTLESVYCKICDVQLEMEVSTWVYDEMSYTEIENAMDEMLNRKIK